MKTTTLISTSFFNPYFLNGKQIQRIIFFDPSTASEIAGFNWIGNNNYHKTLVLPFDIVRAVKLNLSRTDAFILACPGSYKFEKNYANIYISVSLLPLIESPEQVDYITTTETRYKTPFTFSAECTGIEYLKNDLGEYASNETPLSMRELTFFTNYRGEQTDTGRRLDGLKELAGTVGIKLSSRDIEQLEKVWSIEKK